jgi:chemotaxis family two-component system sensor kinase Cph1
METIVRSALARLDQEMRTAGGAATYNPLPRVTGDSDRLIELIENLVRNSLECAAAPPPEIRIDARQKEGDWLFSVTDNGRGVEPEYLEKIFLPFERLRANHRPGLGLAICRVIVERHGGRIWAEPRSGSGLAVFFTLPAG